MRFQGKISRRHAPFFSASRPLAQTKSSENVNRYSRRVTARLNSFILNKNTPSNRYRMVVSIIKLFTLRAAPDGAHSIYGATSLRYPQGLNPLESTKLSSGGATFSHRGNGLPATGSQGAVTTWLWAPGLASIGQAVSIGALGYSLQTLGGGGVL